MIKVENLQKRIPMAGTELEILKGITLQIDSGEIVAMIATARPIDNKPTRFYSSVVVRVCYSIAEPLDSTVVLQGFLRLGKLSL